MPLSNKQTTMAAKRRLRPAGTGAMRRKQEHRTKGVARHKRAFRDLRKGGAKA